MIVSTKFNQEENERYIIEITRFHIIYTAAIHIIRMLPAMMCILLYRYICSCQCLMCFYNERFYKMSPLLIRG